MIAIDVSVEICQLPLRKFSSHGKMSNDPTISLGRHFFYQATLVPVDNKYLNQSYSWGVCWSHLWHVLPFLVVLSVPLYSEPDSLSLHSRAGFGVSSLTENHKEKT